VLYDALFDVANPDQVLMTQMTAQVFFVIASAKDAVLVPLTALRPAAAERQPRAAKVPATPAAGGSTAAPAGATGAAGAPGAARGGSLRRASGADARNQFANGRALVGVVDAAGKVTEREVKVGVMNRVSAQILSGLEPGEKVVIGIKAPAAAARAQSGSGLVPTAPRGGGRP
jgi:macrolide-specific efflux system membrane fusion protein